MRSNLSNYKSPLVACHEARHSACGIANHNFYSAHSFAHRKKMTAKKIPERLYLSPNVLRKPNLDGRRASFHIYSSPDDGRSTESLEGVDHFLDVGGHSVWESSTESLSLPLHTPSRSKTKLKSTERIKRWFFRRKTPKSSVVTSPTYGLKTPSTAPAYINESEPTLHHSRSVPNLTIETSQLTLEQLAKIDAFYAPTPVLPATPAPRLGKVYPPWSPDIDYRVARSASLRVGTISARTASVERRHSRDGALKRSALRSAPSTSGWTIASQGEPLILLQPQASPSESTFDQQPISGPASASEGSQSSEVWRRTWVYSKGEDELYSNLDNDGGIRVKSIADWEGAADKPSEEDSLYFTMGESPVIGGGEVTLRFIEDPYGQPVSGSQYILLPSVPSSPKIT
ncbi:hypothetical protein APHAL10511_007832 [Amanita phalloides]|nr:hypothetical protein APHAL10511_007832 [Amanita phalloides]